MDIFAVGGNVAARVVLEGDDRLGVVQHGGHKDFAGFDVDFIKGAGADDDGIFNPEIQMILFLKFSDMILNFSTGSDLRSRMNWRI
jgi:hypothetical protein